MTFDFAPDWLAAEPDLGTSHMIPAAIPAANAPPPCAPTHPTDRQLADLVGELFTEGTLSWEQLLALGTASELSQHLASTIDSVSLARRKAPTP